MAINSLELISYTGIFFISFLLVKAFFSASSKRSKLPPGPVALPIIGHLHLLGPRMHETFHKLSKLYGPLMSIRIGSLLCVVASSPEIAKELLKTNELAFAARPHTAAIEHLTYNSSFAFAPYGPYWKFIKKISTIELLGSRTLGQLLPIRSKELHHLVKFLLERSKAGQSVNITEELLKLTNNVISQMMFSIRCSETDGQTDDAGTLAREVTEIFGEFNVSDVIWFLKNWDLQGFRRRFKDLQRRFDALLEKIITTREEERKEKKKRNGGGKASEAGEEEVKDFLDILLDFSENENSEMQLTRDHIKALFLDFLTAGTDTSAMSVEWALAELINHPLVLEKAQKEIDEVVGRSRLVQESDCSNLPYIQAIVKETFRIHPPIPMLNRKCIEECKIGKYTIPEGTLLFVNNWSIGRNPNVWNNPMKFQPERFLQSEDENDGVGNVDFRGLHYQLLPFGTGRRGCPGINLAMQELLTTLAALIQCFNWKVVDPQKGDNVVDMSERPGLAAPRALDLVCIPVARCAPLI